jgi:hypothetical protein
LMFGVRVRTDSESLYLDSSPLSGTQMMADMARLHTQIRPLQLSYVDAGPSLTGGPFVNVR